jgi:hypothetical protein
MVRLDRTIGVPKIALTPCDYADGPVEPDHDEGSGGATPLAVLFSPMGSCPMGRNILLDPYARG